VGLERRTVRDVRATACFALALLALVAAFAVVMSARAERAAGRNGVRPTAAVADIEEGETACQPGELLPAGTATVRIFARAHEPPGPRLTLTLRRGRHVLGRYGGRMHGDAIVPIRRVTRDLEGVTVCLTAGPGRGISLYGDATPPDVGQLSNTTSDRPVSATIEYLRGGRESWWSRAAAIATRIGRGRAGLRGAWIAWAAAALVLAAIALAVWAVLTTVVRERPPALRPLAWTVAAVAVCNAAAWSIVTPAFQVPDEPTHVAYVEQVAERAAPPSAEPPRILPPDLVTSMRATRFGEFDNHLYQPAVWAPSQQRRLERDLDAPLSSRGSGNAGPADPEPPLFYALQAIPFRLAFGATLLDKIALMRLVSALMAGSTALFVLLYLRECLPGRPWAWTVGGLGAAFAPMLGFVSGGVNPDALLFAVCAALFYLLARAFRRGLTPGLAVWIGAVFAAGMVGKINFYGVAPGAALTIVLAARASEGAWSLRAARLAGIAIGIGVAPYVLMLGLDALVWDRTFILAHTRAEAPQHIAGLSNQLGYLWQVYLPRLPGQRVFFPDFYPGYELWFKTFFGAFGWVVVTLPEWAYRVALAAFAAVGALALRALVSCRAELRRRAPELLGYVAIAAGLLLLIGMVALRGFAPGIRGALQGRYLLPLLAPFGAMLALAARGAGERWGRAAGATIVVAAIAWSVFGQLATIAFFYG
jgi:predicted membrane protein DUF2142